MSKDNEKKGGRILIGIAPLPAGEVSIQIAVRFATATNREVMGVFIHEQSLLNIIHLPIASIVNTRGVAVESSHKKKMLQEIESMVKRYARSIESEATKRNIKWDYRQSGGTFGQSLDSQKTRGDFFVVPAAYYRSNPKELIELVQNLSSETPGVIVTPALQNPDNSDDVSVIISGSRHSDSRVLDLGLQLAAESGGKLNVLAARSKTDPSNHYGQYRQSSSSGHSGREHLFADCQNRHLVSTMGYTFKQIDEPGPISLVSYIQHQKPAYVVLDSGWSFFEKEATVSYLFRLIKSPMVLLKTLDNRHKVK